MVISRRISVEPSVTFVVSSQMQESCMDIEIYSNKNNYIFINFMFTEIQIANKVEGIFQMVFIKMVYQKIQS